LSNIFPPNRTFFVIMRNFHLVIKKLILNLVSFEHEPTQVDPLFPLMCHIHSGTDLRISPHSGGKHAGWCGS
jgi:hypothetical protein